MDYDFPHTRFESCLYRFYRLFLFKRCLKYLGKGAFISPYSRLQHMECISIGSRSHIGRGTLIQAVTQYLSTSFTPSIVVEDNVYIGSHCTLSAPAELSVGAGTTIGDHVYVGGGRHGYEDIHKRVLIQPLLTGSIRIGPCAWIGYGSFVAGTGDLEIGEHAVVAANSVVTKSVPPYTVVAGAPARTVKRYDFQRGLWVRLSVSE